MLRNAKSLQKRRLCNWNRVVCNKKGRSLEARTSYHRDEI